MMRPGRELITMTRSDIDTASDRSWVMNSTVRRSCCHSDSRTSSSCSFVCASSAPNRLVHQQDRRVQREGTRERHALAHALRQRLRIGVLEILEADLFQQVERSGAALLRRHAAHLGAEFGVAKRPAPWRECVPRQQRNRLRRLPRPALDGKRPAPRFNSVVLPQPEGPTIETNSPGAIFSENSDTAVKLWRLRTPPTPCRR